MPKVPVYGPNRVSQAPLNTPYQTTRGLSSAAFGAGIGQSLQEFGGGLQRVSDLIATRELQIAREDNEARARELDAQAASRIREIMNNPESGFLVSRGRNTLDSYTDTVKRINDVEQELSSQITNPEQAAMFRRYWLSRRERTLGAVDSHTARERVSWLNDVDETTIREAIDDALANRTNPVEIAKSLTQIDRTVDLQAARNGWSAEVAKSKKEQVRSALHKGVVDAFQSSGQYLTARQYYEALKEDIDPSVRAGLEKSLKEGVTRQVAQQASDSIMARQLSRTEALKLARRIKDPLIRDEVVKRVDMRYDEVQTARNENDRELRRSAISKVEQGKIDQLTTDERDAMHRTAGGMAGLERRAAQIASGHPINSDPHVENELSRMSPEQLQAVDFTDSRYVSGLDPSRYHTWLDRQSALNRARDPSAKSAMRTRTQMLKGAIDGAGIKSAKKQELLSLRLDERIAAYEQSTRKKAEPEDVRRFLDELMIQGEVKGSWVDVDRRRFEVTPEEEEMFFIDQGFLEDQSSTISRLTGIPEKDLDSAARALGGVGIPVTIGNLRRLHEEAQ